MRGSLNRGYYNLDIHAVTSFLTVAAVAVKKKQKKLLVQITKTQYLSNQIFVIPYV